MIQLYRKRYGMERIALSSEIPSLAFLFTNQDKIITELKKIGDLHNVFYTVNDSGAGDREFARATHLALDIDYADATHADKYLDVVKEICGGENENWTVVASGHGLHFLMPLTENRQWSEKAMFTRRRLQFRPICSRLQGEFEARGLPGKADSGVFDGARVLRMPGTINAKEGKPEVPCALLRVGLTPYDFNWEDVSGISLQPGTGAPQAPTDPGAEAPRDTGSVEWHGDNDEDFILTGCAAIALARTKPQDVDEPLWYAIDSVVGRFKEDRGRKLLHKWSASHPSYTPGGVDAKIDQALAASGPRTCKHIEGLWDGCKGCKFYDKVKSPIMLRGPDFISTASTGYHSVVQAANGQLKYIPNFEDMLKQFRKTHTHHVSLARTCYLWRETHYVAFTDQELEAYAFGLFRPRMAKLGEEFRKQVHMKEVKGVDWFSDSTEGKLNLKNGVWDLRKRVFLPHDPKFGFRNVLPFNWDPEARAPEFEKFLKAVTCGDRELEAALLQFIAYAISGERCFNEKILVLHGSGSNGKSTFLRIVRALFGNAHTKFQSSELTKQFERRRLDGALLAVIEEMPKWSDSGFWDIMKDLASGGETSVAFKNKDSYIVENRAKFILTCNELPSSAGDVSFGYFRRLLMIPFNADFLIETSTRDEAIGDRIIAGELSGVLNLVLKHYAEMQKTNFRIEEPIAARAALDEYKAEQDNVLAWLNDTLRVVAPGEAVPTAIPGQGGLVFLKDGQPMAFISELHARYMEWGRINGHQGSRIVNNVHFARRLRDLLKGHKVVFAERKIGGIKQKVLVGVLPANLDRV